jgi:hypothetical protein
MNLEVVDVEGLCSFKERLSGITNHWSLKVISQITNLIFAIIVLDNFLCS